MGKVFPISALGESPKFEGVQAQAFSCIKRFLSLNWTFHCCANKVSFFSRWFPIYHHSQMGWEEIRLILIKLRLGSFSVIAPFYSNDPFETFFLWLATIPFLR
jgi:hypothetical protein